MKVQLQVDRARYDTVRAALERAGIEIAPDAEFLLSARNSYTDTLFGKAADGYHVLPVDELLYAESFGHDITLHAARGAYAGSQPLYQLEALLDGARFMRISSSVIVARHAIQKIGVSLRRRFTLTLTDGARVDVTRSYYEKFKDWMGF